MKKKQGGTQIYCPKCLEVRVCEAVSVTGLGKPPGQRWYKPGHEDLQWFRRGRKCTTCSHKFITAEVQEDFLEEIVELRVALQTLKSSMERYEKESQAASDALGQLSHCLNNLRALRVYVNAKDFRDVPLDQLGLAATTRKICNSAGIRTIRELTERTAEELLEIKNFGEANLREVCERLAHYKLTLKV